MISKTESGWVGYRKKYRVAGRVRVPAGHCLTVELTNTALPFQYIYKYRDGDAVYIKPASRFNSWEFNVNLKIQGVLTIAEWESK